MEIFKDLKKWQTFRGSLNETVGFVPTMGALHQGHLSLVQKAKEQNQKVVVSIFVNPTQFDDPKDLKNYPHTLDTDILKLQEANVDYLLLPTKEDMYPDGFSFQIQEKEISPLLCGAHRPGHFTGMLTVVLKLLQLTQATRSYFGEKDYQQYQLIKELTEAFFIPTEIVPCPIVREESGLAMSSRNKHLTSEEKKLAAQFYGVLSENLPTAKAEEKLQSMGFKVDYLENRWGRLLGAVHLGKVRLIDNVPRGLASG